MRTPMGSVSPPPPLLLLGLCAFAQLGAVASAAWWSLALWTPRVDPSTHPLLLCSMAPGLSPTQRQICQQQPHFMKLVAEGVQLAISEYRHQFQAKRSNWTTQDWPAPLPRAGSREAAFFTALTSAGVVHVVARACYTSQLIRDSCNWTYDPLLHHGDNIQYGVHFAKVFVDASVHDRWRRGGQRKSLAKLVQMDLHNYEVGRVVVEHLAYYYCGCDNRTGECHRVCLPLREDFRDVGDFLKEKYERSSAMRLVRDKRSGSGSGAARWRLEPVNEWLTAPSEIDLVHVNASPEHCVRGNTSSAGGAGQRCNDTELPEGCTVTCCDRGYDISQVTLETQCGCKEQLKQNVKCKLCPWTVDQFVCK
ncbi:protein Wnt-5a-like [Lethenteron reissneri]|uniref:protein Wnt-5a-like n=1 Tax=Lethenteron reissneri TaxID=7753 RepID=UPI002AB60F7B|nr:protein Wnt-5a-like [Lethenteron reissneri]